MRSAPHIALFMQTLGGGGAERVMLNLSRAFSDMEIRTDLIVGKAQGELASEVSERVNLIDLNVSRIAYSLIPLVRYLKINRPKAILSTIINSNVMAIAATQLARTNTRCLIRETTTISRELARKNSLFKTIGSHARYRVARAIYPLSDRIIAPSLGSAVDLKKYVPNIQVEVIPNPSVVSNLEDLKDEAIEHSFFQEENATVFVAVGRLTQAKDYSTLLKAFALIHEKVNGRLIILGEGELREETVKQIADLKLTDHVSLPGFVLNPYPYLSRASVYVLSSAWEGLPNVLIQALACNCSIVATDCENGPSEILDHGRLGLLVPVGDHEAMAGAMLQAIDAPPRTKADLDRELEPYRVRNVAQKFLEQMLGD